MDEVDPRAEYQARFLAGFAIIVVKSERFCAIVAGMSAALGVVGSAILVAMLLIVTANVLLRYGFNAPIGWADQVTAYGLVYVTFLGHRSPWRNGHMSRSIFCIRCCAHRAAAGCMCGLMSWGACTARPSLFLR